MEKPFSFAAWNGECYCLLRGVDRHVWVECARLGTCSILDQCCGVCIVCCVSFADTDASSFSIASAGVFAPVFSCISVDFFGIYRYNNSLKKTILKTIVGEAFVKSQLKYAALLLCAAVVFPSLGGCSAERMPEYYENSYDMGSDVLSVRFAYDTGEKDEKGKKVYFTDSQLEDVFSQCCDLYEDAGRLTDHTDTSAGLHAINEQVDAVFDCDWELMGLLKRACELTDITNGYYQPVFGTVLRLLEENPQPEGALLDAALSHTGTDKITVQNSAVYKMDPQAQVDLIGVRDGYALETIIAYLNESPVVYGFVTLNDSVGVFGTKADAKTFEIGIADDTDTSVIGAVQTESGYVFIASDAVNYQTGESAASDLSRVVVLADDAVAANGLAGALYAMGYEAGQALYDSTDKAFEAVFFLCDGTVKLTDGAYRMGLYHPVSADAKEK